MKVVLVGESGEHRDELMTSLHGDHSVVTVPATAAYDAGFDDVLVDADVVVSRRLSRPSGRVPDWGLLQVPGAGLDEIDLTALAPETTVCNVYEHEIPIAEFVMCAVLEWEIGFHQLCSSFDPGRWPSRYRDRVAHGEACGRRLGLVGYGRVGKAIASRALAFGLDVVAVSRCAGTDGAVEILSPRGLPELLTSSDYVVIACPLNDDTRGMLDAAALARMKRSAVLVNVARAAIVDEESLYLALAQGLIAGAVLDVWYSYPSDGEEVLEPSRYPFADMPNVWCTPHSSAWTRALSVRRYTAIADNIDRFSTGDPLANVVRRGVPRRPPR
jgi:phosphoglycerate dehydrogenase-like enzyme